MVCNPYIGSKWELVNAYDNDKQESIGGLKFNSLRPG